MSEQPEEKKKVGFSLPQAGGDRAAKIIEEKLGGPGKVRRPKTPARTIFTDGLSAEQEVLAKEVVRVLRTIFDPELPLNIYDLGLIYSAAFGENNALAVRMTLTAPACPVADEIVRSVETKLRGIAGITAVKVQLVWEPAWSREMLSEAAKLQLGLI